ncbi:hypothetical protein LX36DRAFT_229051 [Colletotrichum falcatum]|nr:hypothetical protein LX36DRAFT_229051 [Colletotrichum falcatum]
MKSSTITIRYRCANAHPQQIISAHLNPILPEEHRTALPLRRTDGCFCSQPPKFASSSPSSPPTTTPPPHLLPPLLSFLFFFSFLFNHASIHQSSPAFQQSIYQPR